MCTEANAEVQPGAILGEAEMLITLESALLCFDCDNLSTEERFSRLFGAWDGTGRLRFMITYKSAALSRQSSKGPFANRIMETPGYASQFYECSLLFGDLNACLRMHNIRNLFFLGPDVIFTIETNVRAATSLGFRSHVVIDDAISDHASVTEDDRRRLQSYGELLDIAKLEANVPFSLRGAGA